MLTTLHQGDTVATLKKLLEAGQRWDYCLTSPPYYRQIDYGIPGQYGLEGTLEDYLKQQAQVFSLVAQGLNPGGVCWIVIGDTSNNYSPIRTKAQRRTSEWIERRSLELGYQEKEALLVPFRLADELSNRWMLRKMLIWNKDQSSQPALGHPPGETHEYILMLAKRGPGRPTLKTAPLARTVLTHWPDRHPYHPCPFPVMLAREILDSCQGTGVVLDPYVGTGTTALACQQLWASHGLSCLGIDLDISHAREALGLFAIVA